MFIIWGLMEQRKCLHHSVGFPVARSCISCKKLEKLKYKASLLVVFLIFLMFPRQQRANLIKINGEKELNKSQYEYSRLRCDCAAHRDAGCVGNDNTCPAQWSWASLPFVSS